MIVKCFKIDTLISDFFKEKDWDFFKFYLVHLFLSLEDVYSGRVLRTLF